MQGGRSPGIDGLPLEFYKTFWPELSEDVLAMFTESHVFASELQESSSDSAAEER